MNISKYQSIIDIYPKKRFNLPKEYQQIYKEHYKKNREGETKATSISIKMERWLHKMVAKDVSNVHNDKTTLEIGAGTFNQLKYEPNVNVYDVIEPFEELYKDSPYRNRIRKIYKDISEINNVKYNRITSVATFEHILNLPEVVAMSALLLEKNGELRVSIPNEGTILWRLGTYITGYEFKKTYGLDYQILMKYEHVNTAEEIEAILNYFFKTISSKSYGISKKIAFYRFFCCSEPDIEKAIKYLENKIRIKN
ncbi:MAG: hypothetical protein A2046_14900 [Bacteroidetes bacterium GWA2_30_7]|nr:MAG: hypothetical protein A2046_14900 [Bacteroidetes bacterium GWA2_30_7]